MPDIHTPTPADLAERVIHETDFLGNLDSIQTEQQMTLRILNCIADVTASGATQLLLMDTLRRRGWAILDGRRREAEMALADGIEAGDLDRDGNWICYDRYRSV